MRSWIDVNPTDEEFAMSTRGNQGAPAGESHEAFSDPVERADRRRESERTHDVTVERDGKVSQEPHGNMDETLVPSGKDHPEQGPYEPGHDELDPALQPDPQAPEVPQPPRGATRRT
jgi:hypothetical protein